MLLETMKRIKSNFHRLHTLKDAQAKLRKAIISNCDKDVVNSVTECALNLLHGNVKLSDCTRRKLRKYRRQLRSLVGRRVPLARKKKFIIQRGRFLVPLLTAVLPTLASLIYDSLKK